MGSIVKPLLPGFRTPVFILCLLMAAARTSSASSMLVGQEVELRLRVQPGTESSDGQYLVILRTTSGECVRIADAVRGEKVHFKHLKPDIYIACVRDGLGREQCKSIDMFPPRESRTYEFAAEITGSMPNGVGSHTVRLQQLEVPRKAREELLLSIKAVIQGSSDGELSHLQRAVAIDPAYVEALNNLGFYYYLKGNEALSIQYFTRAVELNPDFYASWSNLAGSLLSTHQWEEALKAISRSLILYPDSMVSNSQAGFCYYQLHRYSEAAKYFKKVLELDPASSTFPMLSLAKIARSEGREEDAEAYVRLFLKIHPNSPDAPLWTETLRVMEAGTLKKIPVVISQNRQPQ
jgi:tetratricopeptide (TPR) repeat protein